MQESSIKLSVQAFPLDAVPTDLGATIADARRARRWSQDRLAARARVSRASVYRLEADRRPSRADTVFRVAHALELNMRDLVPLWPEWQVVDGVGHGPRTRARRRALGLSLAELAAVAGVSEATLSRHERGVGASPMLVQATGDEHWACNDALAQALGFADADVFDEFCRGQVDA